MLISHGVMGGISFDTVSRKEFTLLGSPISELCKMEDEISDLIKKDSYLPILMTNVVHYKFHAACRVKECLCFKTSAGNYIVLKNHSYLNSENLDCIYNNNNTNNTNNTSSSTNNNISNNTITTTTTNIGAPPKYRHPELSTTGMIKVLLL